MQVFNKFFFCIQPPWRTRWWRWWPWRPWRPQRGGLETPRGANTKNVVERRDCLFASFYVWSINLSTSDSWQRRWQEEWDHRKGSNPFYIQPLRWSGVLLALIWPVFKSSPPSISDFFLVPVDHSVCSSCVCCQRGELSARQLQKLLNDNFPHGELIYIISIKTLTNLVVNEDSESPSSLVLCLYRPQEPRADFTLVWTPAGAWWPWWMYPTKNSFHVLLSFFCISKWIQI